MAGLLERFFGGEREAPKRGTPRTSEGKRMSREHPREFRDVLREQLLAERMKEKPLFQLNEIKKAERALLPALEERVDRHELDRGRPLAREVLRGTIPDRIGRKKKRTVDVTLPATRRGRPRYSPALLTKMDYGSMGRHDSLRLTIGELLLGKEKLRALLLALTQETNEKTEQADSIEEKNTIRDDHRHKRLALLRELRETQAELLETTKALDTFLKIVEQQKEKPSLVRNALDLARNFLAGTSSQKTPKSVRSMIQGKKKRGGPETKNKDRKKSTSLVRMGSAVQATWQKLTGTKKPHATIEELYATIEEGLLKLTDIEQKAAARISGGTQPFPETPITGVLPESPPVQEPEQQKIPVSQTDAEMKAAVFPPIALHILPREQLKGMSPDGLRYYIVNRLMRITGADKTPMDQHGLMLKDEYERALTNFLQDPRITEAEFDAFNTFLHEEISELESKPSTTFKGGGGILGIFTRTIQMIAGERQMRHHTAEISGDFLRRAGIIEKKEKVERGQFLELLEEYIRKPERKDQEIASLLNKVKTTETLWTSDAFGDMKERLSPIVIDAKELVHKELDRRKKVLSARGSLLSNLGFSVKEDQQILQEQFDEAITMWINDPRQRLVDFHAALETVSQFAEREKDNQHITELYKNVAKRITARIHDLTPNKQEGLVELELGKLLKNLGIQQSEAPVSPSAAQLHADTWLNGVPEWSDNELRNSFAAVNALIAKEGMVSIRTGNDSPFLPFLRAVNTRLKEERLRRSSLNVSTLHAQESAPLIKKEEKIDERIQELFIQSPAMIRGELLTIFGIPGADIAVGERYFINRLNEWLELPETTEKQKRDLLVFCQVGTSIGEASQISKKRQKQRIFDQILERLEASL